MNINRDILEKLQGLNPCTSSVTFVPSVYKELEDEEGMEDYTPSFTCDMLSNKQVEQVKGLFVDIAKSSKDNKTFDKKSEMLSIVGGNITGWKNMIDLSNGDSIAYSEESVKLLTENVIESILVELAKYAGFIPR